MSAPDCSPKPRREEGSAYLAVLLVLIVLTILGLSLATVTSLEMEIGTSERNITRTFYAANSGLNVAIAKALRRSDVDPAQLELHSSTQTPHGLSESFGRGHRLALSRFAAINNYRMDLSGMNSNEQDHWVVTFAVSATATEVSWSGSDEAIANDATAQAQKTLATMIDIMPRSRDVDTLPTSPEEVAGIKF